MKDKCFAEQLDIGGPRMRPLEYDQVSSFPCPTSCHAIRLFISAQRYDLVGSVPQRNSPSSSTLDDAYEIGQDTSSETLDTVFFFSTGNLFSGR